MRAAVIADVHADWPALCSVAAAIEAAGIEEVWCLGDWASGGPSPVECFEWVTARCGLVLGGNHEAFVLARIWERVPEPQWARAADFAARVLGPARVRALRAFAPYAAVEPPTGGAARLEAVHASLADPWMEFLNTAPKAAAAFSALRGSVLLFAHTHRPALWRPDGDRGALSERISIGRTYSVTFDEPRGRRLVNPGAVADPAGARWLELGLEPGGASFTWHRTAVRGHGNQYVIPHA